MLQADLLESISETKYLSADNYTVYRTIMRLFYLEPKLSNFYTRKETFRAANSIAAAVHPRALSSAFCFFVAA